MMRSSSSGRSSHSLSLISLSLSQSSCTNGSLANDSLTPLRRVSISMNIWYWSLSSGILSSKQLSADWVRLTSKRSTMSKSSTSLRACVSLRRPPLDAERCCSKSRRIIGMRSLLITSLLSSSRLIVFSFGSSRRKKRAKSLAASFFKFIFEWVSLFSTELILFVHKDYLNSPCSCSIRHHPSSRGRSKSPVARGSSTWQIFFV